MVWIAGEVAVRRTVRIEREPEHIGRLVAGAVCLAVASVLPAVRVVVVGARVVREQEVAAGQRADDEQPAAGEQDDAEGADITLHDFESPLNCEGTF